MAPYREQRAAWFWTGIIAAGAVNIIGTIDAVIGCESFNAKLKEKYHLVSTGEGAGLVIEF
jgi:hypothetical protein